MQSQFQVLHGTRGELSCFRRKNCRSGECPFGWCPITLERKEALFPPKRSGLVIHPQATYDAYILTIGSGRGDNWWCAIFPKICFPDKREDEEEKVTFFVWEWIKGMFS